MATRSAVVTTRANGVVVITWSGLLNGDNGDGQEIPWQSEKCFHVTGTFGVGGSVSLKGTNTSPIVTGADIILRDPQANALTFTAAGLKQILENPLLIYPHVTAGDGTTSLTVVVVCKPQFKL